MEFMPYDIEHRQGKLHSNADCLSRIPWTYEEEKEEGIPLTDYSNIVSAEVQSEPLNVFGVQQSEIWQNNWTLGPLQGWSLKQIAEAQEKESNIASAISWVKDSQSPPPPPEHQWMVQIVNFGQYGHNFRDSGL